MPDDDPIRREDLEHRPSLLNMIYADMERPGSVDWSAVLREDPPPPTDPTLADAIRASAREAATAHYEPTGLVMHPVDHASVEVTSRPDDPETVEAAKRVADAFGVPYWLVGIPGYRPPLRVRVRRRLRRLPRTLLTALPLVERPGPRYVGPEWFGETVDPRAGRWFIHVGAYRVGITPESEED